MNYFARKSVNDNVLPRSPTKDDKEDKMHQIARKLIRFLENKVGDLKAPSNFFEEGTIDAEQMKALLTTLEKENDAAVSSLTNDPRLVGELLVICLSQSDPLIPADMYDAVLLSTTLQNQPDKVRYLQETIARVPSPVKKALIELLSLLKTLSLSASHKAKSQDLAKVFARLLLRPKERLFYMEHDNEHIQSITKTLIEEKMA